MKYSIYVINMDKDMGRLTFVENEFTNAGLNFKRIRGVPGKDVTDAHIYDIDRSTTLNGSKMWIGEVGCAMSHLNAINEFLASDDTHALICEDDISIPKNFKKHIDTAHRTAPCGEYILFDYLTPGFPFLKFWLHSINLNFRKQKTLFSKFKFISISILKGLFIFPLSIIEGVRNVFGNIYPHSAYFARPLYLAGCYLISRSGAEKIKSLQTPLTYPADKVPQIAKKELNLKFYGYCPVIIKQQKDKFESRINI